ncbi:hypothetical protein DPMN_110217 [Dreissena polymorpha]|uniref:Uncharacterized protein n=1 Tax=Dreissena polymorpha TaxID=45954 RepID=A0A9D4KC01_DREPO|nr:hypothetical protein DPMN_110217 [Dreissena polymorpha]
MCVQANQRRHFPPTLQSQACAHRRIRDDTFRLHCRARHVRTGESETTLSAYTAEPGMCAQANQRRHFPPTLQSQACAYRRIRDDTFRLHCRARHVRTGEAQTTLSAYTAEPGMCAQANQRRHFPPILQSQAYAHRQIRGDTFRLHCRARHVRTGESETTLSAYTAEPGICAQANQRRHFPPTLQSQACAYRRIRDDTFRLHCRARHVGTGESETTLSAYSAEPGMCAQANQRRHIPPTLQSQACAHRRIRDDTFRLHCRATHVRTSESDTTLSTYTAEPGMCAQANQRRHFPPTLQSQACAHRRIRDDTFRLHCRARHVPTGESETTLSAYTAEPGMCAQANQRRHFPPTLQSQAYAHRQIRGDTFRLHCRARHVPTGEPKTTLSAYTAEPGMCPQANQRRHFPPTLQSQACAHRRIRDDTFRLHCRARHVRTGESETTLSTYTAEPGMCEQANQRRHFPPTLQSQACAHRRIRDDTFRLHCRARHVRTGESETTLSTYTAEPGMCAQANQRRHFPPTLQSQACAHRRIRDDTFRLHCRARHVRTGKSEATLSAYTAEPGICPQANQRRHFPPTLQSQACAHRRTKDDGFRLHCRARHVPTGESDTTLSAYTAEPGMCARRIRNDTFRLHCRARHVRTGESETTLSAYTAEPGMCAHANQRRHFPPTLQSKACAHGRIRDDTFRLHCRARHVRTGESETTHSAYTAEPGMCVQANRRRHFPHTLHFISLDLTSFKRNISYMRK